MLAAGAKVCLRMRQLVLDLQGPSLDVLKLWMVLDAGIGSGRYVAW